MSNKFFITEKNNKMGKIPSFSLPAIISCNLGLPCYKYCYARRTERYPNVKNAYQSNYDLLFSSNDGMLKLYIQVNAYIELNDENFFRWFGDGDMNNSKELFMNIISIAVNNSQTNFWLPTKCYSVVNDYLDNGGKIPYNLCVGFSADKDLIKYVKSINTHHLPIYYVGEKSEFTQFVNYKVCPRDNDGVTQCKQCKKCFYLNNYDIMCYELRE